MVQTTFEKKDGKVTWQHSLEYMVSKVPNGVYTVELKRKQEERSVNQNALMWMWLKCIEDETGMDKNDLHDYYCAKFLARRIDHNGRFYTVNNGTSKLTKAQFTEFLEKIQIDAAAELGITLPLPADRFYQEFVNQYRNKIY